MTNEQLAVLLNGYAERLRTAIQEADDALGDSVEREVEWKYIGEVSLFGCVPLFSNPANSPKDWEAGEGPALALDPLLELAEDMEADVESLSPE